MSRESSFLVRSMPAVRTMKPRPLGGLSSSMMSRSLQADVFVLDFPRDADAAQRRHQDQVAAGNADVGRERGALGADAFLGHLDEHLVAAAEDVLNGRLDARADAGPRTPRPRPAIARFPVVSRASGAVVDRVSRVEAALAEVLRLDVADVEEAVASDAEVDERGLDARLQVDDDALVDVADVVVLRWCARRRVLRGRRPQRSRSGILPAAKR